MSRPFSGCPICDWDCDPRYGALHDRCVKWAREVIEQGEQTSLISQLRETLYMASPDYWRDKAQHREDMRMHQAEVECSLDLERETNE